MSQSNLELAENIKAITSCPMFQLEGDQLITMSKLLYDNAFEKAAAQLAEYKQARYEHDQYVEDSTDPSHLTLYHSHIHVHSELSYLQDAMSILWIRIVATERLDRTKPVSGVWALCKFTW